MNVSKTLSSAVAAATIVGAVGLAYAQATNDTTAPPADSSMTTTPATSPSAEAPSTTLPSTTAPSDSSSSSMSQSPSTTTAPSSDTYAALPADLQPKPDRN